jgi:hypothetical protein
MRRTIIVVLAGLVVLALGAAGYWYLTLARAFEAKPVPPALLAAEDALALPGLLALAHFDLSYAVRAERAYYGPEDAGALPEPLTGDDSLLQDLRTHGIDVREALDQALFGVGIFGDTPGAAAVLLGRFPLDRLTAAMTQAFMVEDGTVGAYPFLRITKQNRDSCSTRTFVAHLAESRIVLASEADLLATVLERLDGARRAERDLTDWRALRTGKVASMAFIAPPVEGIDAVEQPILKAMAEGMKDELLPLRGIYGGIGLQILPPAINLDGWVEADGPAWPRDRLADFRGWRQDVVRNTGTSVPTLVHLYDRLEVEADGPRLRFGLELEDSVYTDAGQVLSELIGLVFSNLGFKTTPGSPQAEELQEEEKIVPPEQVPLLTVDRSHERLEPFGEDFRGGVAWQAEAGPFGLRIMSLRINAEDPEVIDIEVEATSSEIPKISLDSDAFRRSDAQAELVVTGVLGHDGRDLLRGEPCGQDRNDKAADLRPQSHQRYIDGAWVNTPILRGTKTVRLQPGIRLEDVASLEGYVRLTLPIDIETHRLATLAAGEVFETGDLRMKFRDGGTRAIAYDVSGNRDRLVEVRALNRTGDYLVPAGGGSSSHRLFGLSSQEKHSFEGEPVEVELLIARDEAVKDYGFFINDVLPSFPELDLSSSNRQPSWFGAILQKTFASLIERAVMGDRCKDETAGAEVGPFRLCPARLQKWGDGFYGQLRFQAPNDNRLTDHLSAVEIVVNSVTLQGADGTPLRQVAADPLRSRVFVSGLSGHGDEDLETWETVSGAFADPEEIGDDSMVGLQGRLSLRMPKELSEPLSLDIGSLGNAAVLPNGAKARLTGYQFSSYADVEVEYQGPRADLLEIVQRSADGTVLGTASPFIQATDAPDTWKLSMSVSDQTAALDFVLAADQHRKDYPFQLVFPE